jgi:hypothetical protein
MITFKSFSVDIYNNDIGVTGIIQHLVTSDLAFEVFGTVWVEQVSFYCA